MTRRSTAERAGLTPEAVVSAAARLSEQSSLTGWTIRDLAAELGTSSSAVYHHVGGIELLHREIARRTLAKIESPSDELTSQAAADAAGRPRWALWFERLLLDGYPELVRTPGLPHWFMMHGPVFPEVSPILETGIGLLREGGFGDRAGIAYALLLNTAMLTIGVGDARLRESDDPERDRRDMLAGFTSLPEEARGAHALAAELIQPYTQGSDAAQAARLAYYEAAIRVTIAGLLAERERL